MIRERNQFLFVWKNVTDPRLTRRSRTLGPLVALYHALRRGDRGLWDGYRAARRAWPGLQARRATEAARGRRLRPGHPGPLRAGRAMKLLIVSSWCPYPADNGSRLRIYHLIRQLARRGHQIKLLALAQDDSDLAAARAGLSPLCALGVELFPSRFFRPGTAKALLGFFSPRPAPPAGHPPGGGRAGHRAGMPRRGV